LAGKKVIAPLSAPADDRAQSALETVDHRRQTPRIYEIEVGITFEIAGRIFERL